MAQGMIGGVQWSQFAFRNSSGYPMGTQTAPNSVSNGTTTHAYLYDKTVSVDLVGYTTSSRSGRGGTREWTKKTSGKEGVLDGSLVLSARDTTLEAYFESITVDTSTVSVNTGVSHNAKQKTIPSFLSIHSFQFDDSDGNTKYWNEIYYNTQYVRSANQTQTDATSGQNLGNRTWSAIHGYSTRTAWGQLLSAATSRPDYDSDTGYGFIADYAYGLTTFVKDGAASTFTVGYRPVSSTVGHSYVFNNGVAETPSSINTTSGLVTLSGAGTAGHVLVILYPTIFQAI